MGGTPPHIISHLETFILQHPFDSCVFPIWCKLCLENNSKRAVSYNLALCILHLPSLTCDAILYFLSDNLYCRYQQGLHKWKIFH